LIVHFDGNTTDKQLFFCTENLDDFGFKGKDKNSLDLRLQDGLPPTEIFTDLKSLMTTLKKTGKKVVPPTPKEQEKALEKKAAEEERVAREMTWAATSSIWPSHISVPANTGVFANINPHSLARNYDNFAVNTLKWDGIHTANDAYLELAEALKQQIEETSQQQNLLREALQKLLEQENVRQEELMKEAKETKDKKG
jgi:hypothetical protein